MPQRPLDFTGQHEQSTHLNSQNPLDPIYITNTPEVMEVRQKKPLGVVGMIPLQYVHGRPLSFIPKLKCLLGIVESIYEFFLILVAAKVGYIVDYLSHISMPGITDLYMTRSATPGIYFQGGLPGQTSHDSLETRLHFRAHVFWRKR